MRRLLHAVICSFRSVLAEGRALWGPLASSDGGSTGAKASPFEAASGSLVAGATAWVWGL